MIDDNSISKAAGTTARVAVACYFFVFGLCIGTWAPHIPLAKERLNVGPGWFGFGLLFLGFGSLFLMPYASTLINRYGSSTVMKIAGATVAILLPLPIIAPNLQTFAMSLFVLGSALGTLDVAMNAHGLIVEQAIKKATMSSFHAIYSIAGLLAAGLAAVLIDNVSEFTRVLLTSITCIGVLLYAASRLLPAQIDKGHSEASFSLPTRATVGIGLLCLIALMIEGSILEWSGIHLRENLKASGIITSINVAAYSGGMALSRLLGDGMRQKFGSTLLVRSSAIATTFFMVLALMVSNSKFAVCAFALSGFALGPIAPILYVSGGRADRISPSRGISSVTTFGFLGIVLGPPFIGMLAELTGLQIALGTVALLSIIIALFANLTKVADINL